MRCGSRGFSCSKQPTSFTCSVELCVAGRPDFGRTPDQKARWPDVPDGAVQPDRGVVLDETFHQRPRLVERIGLTGTDRITLERLVPALDLPVRLWVIRRGPNVRHPRQPDELFEVLRDELGAVVRDD